ncbi:hypothetical protein [Dyella sp. GSA-30]|uniref:hypothetical protein n=1 Tax=Dyella sp. GSA-30 TaxID=2994496 RepID=UPI00248FB2E2|nr:hypothetical protein [Dyella sp. GSA-30]
MHVISVERATNRLVVAGAFVILLLFAGLIPLGPWLDEFYLLNDLHSRGFSATIYRIFNFSPRPLSELLLYFYCRAIDFFKSPLVVPFVSLFWIALVTVPLIPTWRSRPARLAVAATLAMLLLGHEVAEVFYWPAGVAAYLPTVIAALAILALDWGGRIERGNGKLWIAVALVVSAASSEVGAMFTAVYASMAIFIFRQRSTKAILSFALPLLVALAVIYLALRGRATTTREIFGDASVGHNPVGAFRALFDYFFAQLAASVDGLAALQSSAFSLFSKVLFFFGVYLALSTKPKAQSIDRDAQAMRLALAASLLITSALTLVASLYQFGVVCCERHDTVRQVYILIAIGSVASYLATRKPAAATRLAGLALLTSILIPLSVAIPKLWHDYRSYPAYIASGGVIWESVHSAGSNVTIPQVMPGQIFGGTARIARMKAGYFPPGIYRHTAKQDELIDQILFFYGKESATLIAPAFDGPDRPSVSRP